MMKNSPGPLAPGAAPEPEDHTALVLLHDPQTLEEHDEQDDQDNADCDAECRHMTSIVERVRYPPSL